MFKKPFKIKSNTRLKSSDTKRLKLTIQKQFSNIPDESLSTLISNKDEVYTVKIVAHSGEIVYLYCVQKLPLLFEINETMYPTVYMLWNFPDLLPTFTTHPQVLNSLSGGADLMLPGVVIQGELSINSYGKLEKGARVSVNLTNNKAPIAVGKSALSSFDMYMSARRGKCVNILHCYDDCLFNYGTTLPKPELGLVYDESDFSNEMDNIQETVTNIQLNDEKQLENVNIQGQGDHYILEENVESIIDKEINENSEVNSDDLLMYCFLKSLRRNIKKDVLPILASTFYKQYVLAALPDGKQIDIKKTKYKKFSTFLTEVAETKIITLEMATKGVQKISSIDFEHDLLKTFYHQYAALEEIAKNSSSNQTKSTNVSNTPKIQERHTVTSAVLPLFSLYLCKKGESLTIENIRKYITDYVNAKDLKDNENKKNVKLDQLLKGIVGGDKDTVTWDMLFNLVLGRMGNSYELSVNEKKPAVIVKGKLQPIDMQVATRVGNKKVTLVSNLELYGINVTEFAHECQHGVGASTTINNVPGSKSSQVQIQGNQVIFVNKLLTEKYKIQKRFIRGLEFSPKNKKK